MDPTANLQGLQLDNTPSTQQTQQTRSQHGNQDIRNWFPSTSALRQPAQSSQNTTTNPLPAQQNTQGNSSQPLSQNPSPASTLAGGLVPLTSLVPPQPVVVQEDSYDCLRSDGIKLKQLAPIIRDFKGDPATVCEYHAITLSPDYSVTIPAAIRFTGS
jgi:hypothetical protein